MTDWRNILLAEPDLPLDKTLKWLEEFTAEMKKIPEVYIWIFPSKRKMRIVIQYDTGYLSYRSPAGTHEFCRGWIVRGIVAQIYHWLPDIEWEQAEWLRPPDCRIRDAERKPVPFELRRVDLQTGQPVN